jgi:hypothetical protein
MNISFTLIQAPIVNPWEINERLKFNKWLQMKRAVELGLEIPDSRLTNNLADRVTMYLKIMNGILSAMATAGAVGFKFDIGLMEITQIQVVMMSANLGIGFVMSKIKDLETRIGSFDLRTVTKQSFIRYKNKVVKSIRTLALQYDLEKNARNISQRLPIHTDSQYVNRIDHIPTSTFDFSKFKVIASPTPVDCRSYFAR